MKHPIRLALLVAALGHGAVHAGPCQDAGSAFDDVSVYDSFCEEAYWAKNANITLGCGESTFCPADPVTRSQMVLFMRRLAAAVFPGVALTESAAPPAGDLDTAPGAVACTTAPFNMPDPPSNGRFWHAQAVVSLQGGASDAEVQVGIGIDLGGAFWLQPHMVSPSVTVPAGQWRNASANVGFALPLGEGAEYRWRITLSRVAGSATTGQLAGLRCQLKVWTSMAPGYSPAP